MTDLGEMKLVWSCVFCRRDIFVGLLVAAFVPGKSESHRTCVPAGSRVLWLSCIGGWVGQ